MYTIFIRTLLIYVILTFVMRLMGKRQLGELQVSELISTLVLSEVAATPIIDLSIPLHHAFIPITTILALELIIPELFFHFPFLRKLIEGTPCFLIRSGKICQKELRKNRITPEEFLASLRTAGISDPSQVDYAILEASGIISVFRHASCEPPTASDLHVDIHDSGIAHILVSDGRINRSTLRGLHLTDADIQRYLRRSRCSLQDVYLLTRDDSGTYRLIRKEEK